MQSPNDLKRVLARVKELARTLLANYARTPATDFQETYLFQDDHFCGVRYRSGPFHASWRTGESEVLIFRNETKLDSSPLDPQLTQKKAA